jgi:hypothetical protein
MIRAVITDVSTNTLGTIEVEEVTRLGDTEFRWSVRATVDRGASMGEHRYTVGTQIDGRLNPLGILRAALNALEHEYTVMDGEVIRDDSTDEAPGPPALER